MDDDRTVLTVALEIAARTYRNEHPQRTILGADPSGAVLDPLCDAIRMCDAFRAVAGQTLYSGGSGPVLDVSSLAVRLFERGSAGTKIFRALSNGC